MKKRKIMKLKNKENKKIILALTLIEKMENY
jgi:hypothetical protein